MNKYEYIEYIVMNTLLIVGVNTGTFAVRLFLYLALMRLLTLQLNLWLIAHHVNNAAYSGSSLTEVTMQREGKRNS